MTSAHLYIGKTKSGRFKVYLWGQSDFHVSNWTGCNYRSRAVEGQPLRGFLTNDEAMDFAKEKFKCAEEVNDYAGDIGDGTHLNDDRFKQMELMVVPLPQFDRETKKCPNPKCPAVARRKNPKGPIFGPFIEL